MMDIHSHQPVCPWLSRGVQCGQTRLLRLHPPSESFLHEHSEHPKSGQWWRVWSQRQRNDRPAKTNHSHCPAFPSVLDKLQQTNLISPILGNKLHRLLYTYICRKSNRYTKSRVELQIKKNCNKVYTILRPIAQQLITGA